MSKVTGALLSLSARGRIAGDLVYRRRAGETVAGVYIKPSDPKTAAQLAQRQRFTWLKTAWTEQPSGPRAMWNMAGAERDVTKWNCWLAVNLPALKGQADVRHLQFSRRSPSAPQMQPVVLTKASPTVIRVTYKVPPTPAGLTIQGFQIGAIALQSSTGPFIGKWTQDGHAPPFPGFSFVAVAGAGTWLVGITFYYQNAAKQYRTTDSATALITI